MNSPRASVCELAGMTSRWTADDSCTDTLSQAVTRAGDCRVIVTAQGPDGSLVGACCAAAPVLSAQPDGTPPALVWALDSDAPGVPVFFHATHIALNYLVAQDAETEAMLRRFAGRRDDKFSSLAFQFGMGGAPLLERAVATFECENRRDRNCGAVGQLSFIGVVRRYRQAWPQAAVGAAATSALAGAAR